MLMDAVIFEQSEWWLAPQQHFQQNMQPVPTVVRRTPCVTLVQLLHVTLAVQL